MIRTGLGLTGIERGHLLFGGAGFRAARAALAARRPRPLPLLADRRVLVVLPEDGPGQRAAWSLLGTLGVPPARVRPVLMAPFEADVPSAFSDDLRTVGDDERDWRRLPTPVVVAVNTQAHHLPHMVTTFLIWQVLRPAAVSRPRRHATARTPHR